MNRLQVAMLPGGRRMHLHDGPIDLIVGADGPEAEVARAYEAARVRFSTILDELCTELPLLRAPTDILPQGSVARRMWRATYDLSRHTFITPMAAVAGAVAEEVLYAMVTVAEVERAHVNDGGDIAIHLTPWQEYRVGVVDRPDEPCLFTHALIHWTDPVRGIATSGWRGRSFSFGIADAVTVLAATASGADAAATLIANAVDLPGHPAVTRVAASDIQPDSDLGARLVTRAVGPLTPAEIAAALEHGVAAAEAMIESEFVIACALHLAGETRTVGQVPLGPEQRLSANG
ncbi:MAG: UPF0280 family protein [Rhizobiales bacterium]|nr:UPF0280 family protein [Hyphomicrobiales bacterium]MBI3674199.1 UPF0280 family protein [Hyphomicrobiales bacterium]